MKFKKEISILVLFIAVLSLVASISGIYPGQGHGQQQFTSIHGEVVKIFGEGLYRNDSVSVASQGIAQDFVTLFLAVPLLLISLYFFRKGSLRGRLLLAGTIGYFSFL